MPDLNHIVSTRSAEGVQVWTMNAAPVNAIDPDFIDALNARYDAALADPAIAVVVIASGLSVFSAGADASWMSRTVADHGLDHLLAEFNRTMDRFRELCLRLRRGPLLTVAAIGGHALAGGLELAAACDLRFVADRDELRLGAPEMKLFGVLPSGGGGAQYLTRLMGPARALHFMLHAEHINPREAAGLGLADVLCPPDELMATTQEFAVTAARRAGRVGISAARRAVFGGHELPLAEALDLDHALHWDAMRRGNFLPGVESFTKRFG
ncbi:enoyl-CoA hydratase/isomerase family protein [Streptomyces albipurpureus]|uniref:Enoyl-CoA hydratase/isomerase family protein n=1 Tax=Streptomyces albipurpureus TaxID=2897419 RepID=A0ABT0V2G9_9ACTN|nr:enoyl-CoA hydratase/isomerase family protein [Streptomyces sp. CWNU-1]MCM2393743.1 enoyl-CoA hydratase/isomerase family protein [Streptomyces sp. CWNU-1]